MQADDDEDDVPKPEDAAAVVAPWGDAGPRFRTGRRSAEVPRARALLEYWSEMMRDPTLDLRRRLDASEHLARALGDFEVAQTKHTVVAATTRRASHFE